MQDFRVHIKHTDGHFEYVPYFCLPANQLNDVIAPSCYSCFDYPNALADLVVRVAWPPVVLSLPCTWVGACPLLRRHSLLAAPWAPVAAAAPLARCPLPVLAGCLLWGACGSLHCSSSSCRLRSAGRGVLAGGLHGRSLQRQRHDQPPAVRHRAQQQGRRDDAGGCLAAPSRATEMMQVGAWQLPGR